MIHVIFLLLLCNLITLKAQAQPVFKKTDGQVFSELKKLKSSDNQIDFIDLELYEYLSRGAYTNDGAKNLVRLRESLCIKNSRRCLSTVAWNKNACAERSESEKGEIQYLIWRSLHSSIKTGKDLDLFLKGLSDCFEYLNVVQLLTAAELALAIEKGVIPGDSFKVLKWIEVKAASSNRADTFSPFERAHDELRKKPVPVQLIARLSLAPLRTLNTKRYNEIAADARRRSSLANYLSSISYEISMTGLISELNAFLDKFPSSVSSLSAANELGLASIRCVHWVSSGNRSRCETLLDALYKKAEATPVLKVNWGLAKARFLYLTGQPDRAVTLIDEMMTLARKHDLNALVPLLHYSLSNYLPLTGQFDKGRSALEVFKSNTANTDMGWIKVILFTRAQAISFMEDKCKASIAFGEAGRAHLSKTTVGPNSELMWIDMMQLMCFAEMKDTPKTVAMHNRIRAYLSRMPDLSYMQLLEQAIMDRVEGLDSAPLVAEVKKQIGDRHPDIVLIESGLKRIRQTEL